MRGVSDVDELALEFEQALLGLDRWAAAQILDRAATGPQRVSRLEQVVGTTLERIGRRWESGDVALSQIYMSGRICEELVDAVMPARELNRKPQPRLALAVLEDHHALGKRIVYSCLRAAGYELRDYGLGVTVDDLVARVRTDGVELLLVSTLMLPSALRVGALTRRLKEEKLQVRVVVGGAPFLFDHRLWQEVGAAAMGRSAADAVALVRQFSESAP